MNLTDLQIELRDLETNLTARLSALHGEIEKMKPQDTPKLDIDFARITSVAARSPLVRDQLRAAQPVTKKTFFAAMAYLIALDSEGIEDKLYYLCRLACGCNYQVSAEVLCQMGLAYAPQDLASLGQCLGGLTEWFMVEALVLANLAGAASREVLGALATLADSLDIGGDAMRNLGRAAQAQLRSGKDFATIEQACFWAQLANCRVGDTFTFGNYPQSANGAVSPIEWQVLRRDSDGLLVISRYALDCKPYNVNYCDITWSQCTLRRWLNNEFINQAFSAAERQLIKEVHLTNPNSRFYSSVPGGPDTDDQIFLLSHDEALQLFANDSSRQCRATDFAKQNNAYTADNGMCYWWLRSPGDVTYHAAIVNRGGGITCNSVTHDYNAVRPAFKIAL